MTRRLASNRTGSSNRIAAANRVAAIHHTVASGLLFTSADGVSFGATDSDSRTPTYLPTIARRYGIGWLRVIFNWQAIEQTQGTQVWTGYDATMSKAAALGLQVQGQIAFVPPWNSSDPNGTDGIATKSHYPPTDYNAWVTFVQTVVNRYPQVKIWEIWNEPDGGFWTPNTDTADYAKLLALSYNAIKAINSSLLVMFGSLARGGTGYNTTFLNSCWSDATYPSYNYCDLMGWHHYSTQADASTQYNYLQTTMGAHIKPVWVNEYGYPSDARQQGELSNGYVGIEGQRRWITDRTAYLKSLGVARTIYFQAYDNSDNATMIATNDPTYALLDSTGNPKI